MHICVITGRLTANAETRYASNGHAVTGFTVANDVGWGDKKRTNFFRCSLWGERGEKIAKYLTKGSKVTVSGEVGVKTWQNKDGENRADLTMFVQDIDLPPKEQGHSNAPAQKKADFQAPPKPNDDFEDDIPF